MPTPRYCLFEPTSPGGTEVEEADLLRAYLNEGRLFRARQAREQGSHSDAIALFEQIKTADSSFQTAMVRNLFVYIYKKELHSVTKANLII